ncbi:arabinose transporter [Enterovirga sp.]|uniref:arabinose transporter n=1 Tax=Enterovirga sp. TaxID=2026350 RepID=UPI002C2BB6BE|nr:arabinose transporter [Enterovirga sp.]HMO30456.1 arabinose transporter [Enterovirga sp.]
MRARSDAGVGSEARAPLTPLVAPTEGASAGSSSVIAALLPLMAVVLVGFCLIGAAMPVLPLHVHDGLGFGPVMVGIVAGSQFCSALLARLWAGSVADRWGAKRAVMIGLVGAAVAGMLYGLSLPVTSPIAAISVLLAGRAVLGAAESFIITGATIWGLARVGGRNAGKVIAWMGTAMFAAFAGGAPVGTWLYERGGFRAIAAATAIAPLLTLLLVMFLHGAVPSHRESPSIIGVISRIWKPGLGAALGSVGFGALSAFSSLLFVERGWTPIWLPFTSYAVGLIAARILFGHGPDRFGGARVAVVSLLVETAGLILIAVAPSGMLAAFGAALTGLGYSLVFPGFGVEAVRSAPAESRGVAMGAYTACLDLALGVSGPVLGLAAGAAGIGSVFLVSALVVAGAIAVGAPMMRSARAG